jgi:NADH-quinone oxidoreductase subunit E
MKDTLIDLDFSELKAFIATTDRQESSLITILHMVQDTYGYIPREAQYIIANELKIPTSQVYGVVSFYSYFTENPKGKYQISVCLGTACYVKGAQDVLEAFEEELGIKYGETTEDLLFSISQTRCLGDCAAAPVIMINDEVIPKVHADEVPAIIEKYRGIENNANI